MFAAHLLVFSSILTAVCCQLFLKALTPKVLNATSGSCLVIPCQLTVSSEDEPNLHNSPLVTWRRGALWKHYDKPTFTDVHRQMEPLMEVLGDLREKNCTSVMMNLSSLHSDRYYFRLQAGALNKIETTAVRINVSDSLPEPNVTVPVLREGESVNLTCTVPVPCPSQTPNVTWAPALGGVITQQTQMNADGTQSFSAILSFVPSFHHHKLNVTCVSIHPREDTSLQNHKTVILDVEYPPKKTHVSLTGLVSLGNNLTLICQSNANPPAAHRWFVMKEGVEEELGDSSVLSFIAARSHTGEYMCEGKNTHGAMNSTKLQISVPGISFSAFLSMMVVLLSLTFLLFSLIIYQRCSRTCFTIAFETAQGDIYANMSAAKSQKPESRPCGDDAIYSNNPVFNFRTSDTEESIYANC